MSDQQQEDEFARERNSQRRRQEQASTNLNPNALHRAPIDTPVDGSRLNDERLRRRIAGVMVLMFVFLEITGALAIGYKRHWQNSPENWDRFHQKK